MKLRITFSKTGMLRYTGHLDLHRLWERTCRRAGIPLRYSQGFHPQPRISLGSALPLGFLGMKELVDIQLDEDQNLKKVLKKLQESAPPGLDISSIEIIDPRQPALQTLVDSAEYSIEFLDRVDIELLESNIGTIEKSESIQRERKGKVYDLRPLILSIRLERSAEKGNPVLFMHLQASPGATGRPEEVLAEMGINAEDTRITRTYLIVGKVNKKIK